MTPIILKPNSEIIAEEKLKAEKELEDSKKVAEPEICGCNKSPHISTEKDAYSSIHFEDALHNQVYVKRTTNRRRREAPAAGYLLESLMREKREHNSYQVFMINLQLLV